ncbi:VOC family protein [Macrococcus equipercicus]|uniref:VOC family protein n=1 Tax=Macrococcus equipercicus TaxID=69967 RepID=A0A9Q9F133_9STAP|nr:VOC family protein [Macrococcus equipercicus]UTH13497.1 VOC family protein [Macrococcus equipercicus]
METKFFTTDTHMGAVHLNVNFMDNSIRFYTDIIGLKVIERNSQYTMLGTGEQPLLYLYETTSPRKARQAGLYHMAFLVPSRTELGNVFQHLINTGYPLSGASDHFVSEAIYLQDPEGNGIEIYRDVPSMEWTYDDNGFINMGTVEMDYQGVLDANDGSSFNGLHPDTVMGHVHLSVKELPETIKFYEDVFGLDVMTLYGSQAAFMSAAGYHHHLGLNTWGRAEDTAELNDPGLRKYEINFPNFEDFEYFKNKLTELGLTTDRDGNSELVRDPNGIGIRVMFKQ